MLRAAETIAEDRHRPPAPGQRGLAVRARAGVRRRRRDGRRAGRRGRLADRGRGLRAGPAGRRQPRGAARRAASSEANRRIYELSRAEHERAGMGTTLTAAYLDDAHARDRPRRRQPRVPVPRRRRSTRLTQDHSLVEELVRAGQADRGAGRRAPAAVDHHPRAGPRADRRGRHLDAIRCARATSAALQRRPDLDDLRGARSREILVEPQTSMRAADAADRRGQRGRAAATTSPSSCSGSRRSAARRRSRRSRRWSACRAADGPADVGSRPRAGGTPAPTAEAAAAPAPDDAGDRRRAPPRLAPQRRPAPGAPAGGAGKAPRARATSSRSPRCSRS